MKNIYLQLSKSSVSAYSFLLFIGLLLTSFFGVGQGTTLTFNSSGSWTVPCGVNEVTVQAWGAGGGGAGDGSNDAVGSGGGGGGGYSSTSITVIPGAVVNYVVGIGGAGGANSGSGGNGGNGGNTSFSTVAANGGLGGLNNGAGGLGGTGTSGNGSAGIDGSTAGGGSGGNSPSGGLGGGATTADGDGSLGSAPGGGGSGAFQTGGSRNSGGAGGNGRIIITFTGPNAGVDQTLVACATSTVLSANTPPASGSVGTWSCVSGCAGISFSNLNDPNATVSDLTIGVNPVLRWTWTGGGAGCTPISDDVVINTVAGPGCQVYCTPTPAYTNPGAGFISNVNINSGAVNNTTGWTTGINFHASCATLTQGQIFPLSITINYTAGANFANYWIDWNGNGVFEASELTALGSITGAVPPFTQSITVPCDAAIGTVRMRVAYANGASPDPCAIASTFGETEDYCLTILPAPLPVSNAGPDQIISCDSETLLDASASVPAAGFWSLVSGTGTITNLTSPTSTVTGMSNGTNVFQWTAVGTCDTDFDEVIIDVSGLPNTPVSAGDDVFTCLQNELLDGSDPAPFTGEWTVTGPGTVTFSDETDPNSSVSFSSNGIYTFTWTVDAGACGFISEDMTFSFGNLPTPDAGLNQTVCPTSTVLNGNDFTGAVGIWSIVSGPGTPGFIDANDPNTLIYGLEVGTYELLWTVSGGGCSGTPSDDVSITVNPCTNTVAHSPNSDQVFTGCDFVYTDDGGAGNYSNNVNQTWTTFCPDDPDAFATITLNAGFMGPFDYMVIYDDDSPGAPIVGGIWYDRQGGGSLVVFPTFGSTITSSTGCLYIQSFTNASTTYSGWTADIGCSSTAGVQTQEFVTTNNCGGGGGITVCSNGDVDEATSNMDTNPPELGSQNQGCLGSQEGASNTWVYINAESDGYISFTLDPAGGQDFDYAIWGPYDGGFACPGITYDEPIRCTWAANGGSACDAFIGLGIENSNGFAVAPGDVSEGGFCDPTFNEGWTYPILASAGDVYVVLFQNYSFNNSSFNFTINTDASLIPNDGVGFATLGCDPVTPLPIQLVSFHGVHQNKTNQLFWTTATESQNAYFIIEKSADGQDWSELARIDGAGFSNDLRNYSTVDRNPLPKVTYYRLLQVDFDGQKRKYQTISIVTTSPEGEVFGDLYPNPTSGEFYFQYSGKNFREPIQLSLVNGMGQVIMTNYYEEFNNSQGLNVDASGLARGTYLVKIQQGDKVEVKRLSVM